MRTSVEFLLGLLDQDGPPYLAAEDFDGPHGPILRIWQGLNLIGQEPFQSPAASCPHCGEGVPYRLDNRHVCATCRAAIDPRHLLLWSLDRGAVLRWIAEHLGLRGGVRPVDDLLWQLGTGEADGEPVECFYYRPGVLSPSGEARLGAYRRVLVLHGLAGNSSVGQPGRWVGLIELFTADGSLAGNDLGPLLHAHGRVHFEAHSGALWAGDTCLGEVPPGSREYHLLACLAEHVDRYVPYADLKREVLRRAGGMDGTDEATFCHGLKRRLKKHGLRRLDELVVTTNKGDGYRLRGHLPDP
jgi:hypothetical protein